MGSLPGPDAGNHQIWTAEIIGEWYPRPTTALTFSFARRVLKSHFSNLLKAFGADTQCLQGLSRPLIGRLGGHLYLNSNSLEAILSALPKPGLGSYKSFWQRSSEDARSTWKLFNSTTLGQEGQREFKSKYQQIRALDFASLQLHELLLLYGKIEELFEQWAAPPVTDFCFAAGYEYLLQMLKQGGHEKPEFLLGDLLCGEQLPSLEPLQILAELAQKLKEDDKLCVFLEEASLDELVSWWKEQSAPFFVEREIGRILHLYGCRRPNELELSTPTLSTSPRYLFAMLKRYLARDEVPCLLKLRQKSLDRRCRAEHEVQRLLGDKRSSLLLKKGTIFNWLLSKTRENLLLRDEQRLARANLIGLTGDLFRAIGHKLIEENVLVAEDDVHNITIEELIDFLNGSSASLNLSALAAIRRDEFAEFTELALYKKIETYGLLYHQERDFFARPEATGLKGCCGQGGSAGCVVGQVLTVDESGKGWLSVGDVLVLDKPDIGYTYIYPTLKAVVYLCGRKMSHGAFIARELGLTVVYDTLEELRLQQGALVEVNGEKGTFRLIEGT